MPGPARGGSATEDVGCTLLSGPRDGLGLEKTVPGVARGGTAPVADPLAATAHAATAYAAAAHAAGATTTTTTAAGAAALDTSVGAASDIGCTLQDRLGLEKTVPGVARGGSVGAASEDVGCTLQDGSRRDKTVQGWSVHNGDSLGALVDALMTADLSGIDFTP